MAGTGKFSSTSPGFDIFSHPPGTPEDIRLALKSKAGFRSWVTRVLKDVDTHVTAVEKMVADATQPGRTCSVTAIHQAILGLQGLQKSLDTKFGNYASSVARLQGIADYSVDSADNKQLEADLASDAQNVASARAEIMRALSLLPDDPSLSSSSRSSGSNNGPPTDTRPKANDSLKPKELDVGANPKEVEAWCEGFTTYYSSSRFHLASIAEQRQYLRGCLSADLAELIFSRTTSHTPVDPTATDGFLSLIREEFDDAEPVFNRRLDFFRLSQAAHESYESFLARVSAQGRMANIENITPEDCYISVMVNGARDAELKREILKLDNITVSNVKRVARRFRVLQNKLATPDKTTVNKVQVSKTAPSCPCCGSPRKARWRNQGYFRHCEDCYKHKKFQSLTCNKCHSKGNHSTSVCTGKSVELPRPPQSSSSPRPSSPSPSMTTDSKDNRGRKPGNGRGPTQYSKKSAAFQTAGTSNCVETNSDSDPQEDISTISVEEVVSTVSEESLDNMTVRANAATGPRRNQRFRIVSCPDTGCRRTISGLDIATKMGVEFTTDEKVKIRAANKSSMDYRGSGRLRIRYQGRTVTTDVLVTSSLSGRLLIGRSDLQTLGVIHPSFPDTLPQDFLRHY